MNYTDDTRGVIVYRERKKQIIDFSGIRYDNITPTDLDGFFEKQNKLFVFFELKLIGVDLPYGQKLALTRLVDIIQSAGKEALVIVCEHNTPVDKDIKAASCIVSKYYYKGKWYKDNKRTSKMLIDKFMLFVSNSAEEKVNIITNFSQLSKKEIKGIIANTLSNLYKLKDNYHNTQHSDIINMACALLTFLGNRYLKEK